MCLVYAAYAAEQEEYGRIVGGIDDYTVPLMDMFFFAYDKVEEGYVDLDEEDQTDLDDLYDQLSDAQAQLLGEHYTRMLVSLDLPEEGEETFAFLQTIHREAERYYDADHVYLVGDSTSDYDLSVSFARDNVMISVLSVAFVILVLLFTFQSVGLPILLILVIQGSIWINFSFPGVTREPIFFLSYLIVSSIQMGANIDYAIVISSRYQELKATMAPREAMIETLNLAFPTVFTSGTILASAGTLIGQLTSDPAIYGVGLCIGRGTIISMFLGDELTEILEALETGASYAGREHSDLTVGVHVLPKFPKDNTDRNRTSPFAFTGNKFEFRSLGSSASISETNTVINTIVAESLRQFADELEGAQDFKATLHDLIVREIKAHKRIIFNGNGYSDEWVAEAEKRGLLNLRSTVDALPRMIEEKNIRLFTSHKVFSATEIYARYEIKLEEYVKVLNIEAETALVMAQREILPAMMRYTGDMARHAASLKELSLPTGAEDELLPKLCADVDLLHKNIEELKRVMAVERPEDALAAATYEHDTVIPAMNAVRAVADELETMVDEKFWPFPTYGDLLFRV